MKILTILGCIKIYARRYLGLIYQFLRNVRRPFASKKKTILFYPPEHRESRIRKSFKYSPFEVRFDEVTPQNISEVDLVFPLGIHAMRAASQLPDHLKDNLIPVPSEDVVDLCDDKICFYEWMRNKGFGDYVPLDAREGDFPIFLKKRTTVWGRGSQVVSSSKELDELMLDENPDDYIRQQVIRSKREYAAHILMIDGTVRLSMFTKYLTSTSVTIMRNGTEKKRTRTCYSPHLPLFEQILKTIDFEGLCCIDYKVIDGKPVIFEINPRMGGSLISYLYPFLYPVIKDL